MLDEQSHQLKTPDCIQWRLCSFFRHVSRALRTWCVTAIDVEIADSDGTIDQGPVDG